MLDIPETKSEIRGAHWHEVHGPDDAGEGDGGCDNGLGGRCLLTSLETRFLGSSVAQICCPSMKTKQLRDIFEKFTLDQLCGDVKMRRSI